MNITTALENNTVLIKDSDRLIGRISQLDDGRFYTDILPLGYGRFVNDLFIAHDDTIGDILKRFDDDFNYFDDLSVAITSIKNRYLEAVKFNQEVVDLVKAEIEKFDDVEYSYNSDDYEHDQVAVQLFVTMPSTNETRYIRAKLSLSELAKIQYNHVRMNMAFNIFYSEIHPISKYNNKHVKHAMPWIASRGLKNYKAGDITYGVGSLNFVVKNGYVFES